MLYTSYRVLIAVAVLNALAWSQQPTRFLARTPLTVTKSSINEPHFQSPQTGALFFNSTFAHGYRHGYEEGFHVGDLDLQMGREPRQAEKISEFRHDCEGFKPAFGQKSSFRHGFQEGFKVGYKEALAGLAFRGTQKAALAAKGVIELPVQQREDFDQGFQGGYLSASRLTNPRPVTVEYAEEYCQTAASVGKRTPEYCSGYSRGYVLGVSDSSITSQNGDASSQHER